ncbi:MobF family relaxase [Streptomyces sp. NPDC001380]|uniref:MobF family relaxase n=1 Tax=Streptomyces sp. NPDC001380 TaxID=3364566 RepID=UPI00369B5A8A
MTVHKLSAGDGYLYYLRETATADVRRAAARTLEEHCTPGGGPPGVWTGSGTAELGVSGTVTEAQMRALYGEGLHPDADRIVAERLAAGDRPEQAVRAARLGRRYYRYRIRAVPHRSAAAAGGPGPRPDDRPSAPPAERPTAPDRAGIPSSDGPHDDGPAYRPDPARGVRGPLAVAGYDLVFAAPKSVSVLWALGDEDTCRTVEQAHDRAVADTLAWIERHALMTRTGAGGALQEEVVGGLVAARYRHYDSRVGDPMLHDHVVVANKVKGRDGVWRSIDGTLLFQMNVPASEHYNQRVLEELSRRLGVAAEPRQATAGRRPVMEVAGIGADLIRAHSRRSADIRARAGELADRYAAAHGCEPSGTARLVLLQQATLDTRPPKEHARPLAGLRADWRREGVATFGADRIDTLLERARAAAAPAPWAEPDVRRLAEAVLETVSAHRAVWRRGHVLAEARRRVVAATGGRGAFPGLAERLTDHVLVRLCTDITPPLPAPLPGPRAGAADRRAARRRGSELYTSAAVLAAEERLIAAARTPARPPVAAAALDAVLTARTGPPDPEAARLARALATGGRLLAVALEPSGPARQGALRLLAEAVRTAGGRTVVLGPTVAAARILAAGTGAEPFALDNLKQATTPDRADPPRRPDPADQSPAGTAARAPRSVRYRPASGDVVVVDRPGEAGCRRLAALVEEARRAGAHVRLLATPAQLAAPAAGSALRLLLGREPLEPDAAAGPEDTGRHMPPTPARTTAHSSAEGGTCTPPYPSHGAAGLHPQSSAAALALWQHHAAAGHTVLLIAADEPAAVDLNRRAQTWFLDRGRLDTSRAAALPAGQQAYGGDLLVTRRTVRTAVLLGGRDFVQDGDLWTVQKVHADGSATARHTRHGGRVRLPADYLCRHAALGHACTADRLPRTSDSLEAALRLAAARACTEGALAVSARDSGGIRLHGVQALAKDLAPVSPTSDGMPPSTAHEPAPPSTTAARTAGSEPPASPPADGWRAVAGSKPQASASTWRSGRPAPQEAAAQRGTQRRQRQEERRRDDRPRPPDDRGPGR